MRAKTVVRAALAGGLLLIAAASFLRPLSPPARPPVPVPPEAREHLTPSGLVGVRAAGLFARIRRSEAPAIVVNAWASWCGSCKEDLPILRDLPKTFGNKVDVLLVSVDESETQPAAAALLKGQGIEGPTYVVEGPLEHFKQALNPRWPGMLPATFLYDPKGVLHYFWGGPVHEAEIASLLRRFLAGERVHGEANFGLAPGAVTR